MNPDNKTPQFPNFSSIPSFGGASVAASPTTTTTSGFGSIPPAIPPSSSSSTSSNVASNNKRRNIIISIFTVLILGIISGMVLLQSRVTTENQASDVYTHEIVCKVSDYPTGRKCTVSVAGSAELSQQINPNKDPQEYIFKVKAEASKSYECKVTCEGLAACIPTDSTSCIGPEPSNTPTPQISDFEPSPTPTTSCLTPMPCDAESEIKKCPADYYCSAGGVCKHPIFCPEVTPSVTPKPSASPTPSPTPTVNPSISPSPTPTLPPGVSPTVTPKPSATPTSAPTPTTVVVCVPPAPVTSVNLSCFVPGVCSWNAVTGADSYKVTIVDSTTGKKLSGFDPLKSTTATRVEYTPVDGHAYVCTVESVNVCGNAQSSCAYRDSKECRETSPTPTTTTTTTVGKSPTVTVTPTTKTNVSPSAIPTLPPGVTSSITPVPTLPVAGSIQISMWAVVGLAAIFFGLVVFR